VASTPGALERFFYQVTPMQCDECDYPLAKDNTSSDSQNGLKQFCYVRQEMQAAVSEREWFKTAHNEWLEEQRHRWRIEHGSREDD